MTELEHRLADVLGDILDAVGGVPLEDLPGDPDTWQRAQDLYDDLLDHGWPPAITGGAA